MGLATFASESVSLSARAENGLEIMSSDSRLGAFNGFGRERERVCKSTFECLFESQETLTCVCVTSANNATLMQLQ